MVAVGCLAAALAGAGGGEVFEDESVGHYCCCGMVMGRGLFDLRMCGRDVRWWWLLLRFSLSLICLFAEGLD